MSSSWPGKELNSDSGGNTLIIKVFYEVNEYDVSVPADSTFGILKSAIVETLGLNPENYRIFFRGREKEDGEDLLTAGIKNRSKVVLMGVLSSTGESPEEAKTSLRSKGTEAVSLVTEEVDKLSEQVSALECVVNGDTKLDDKDFIYLTEMLMRQLLKLDGIESEGEGRVQRKLQVSRVQGLIDKMDSIRSKNSNPVSDVQVQTSESIQWETFEPVIDDSPTDSSSRSDSGSSPSTGPPSAAPYPSPVATSFIVPAIPAAASHTCSDPPPSTAPPSIPAQVHFVPYVIHSSAGSPQPVQYYLPVAMPTNPFQQNYPENAVPDVAYVVPVASPVVPWPFPVAYRAQPPPPPPPTKEWERFE